VRGVRVRNNSRRDCINPKVTPSLTRLLLFNVIGRLYDYEISKKERTRLFDWISPKLDLSNLDCQHFYARFNNRNQYRVKTTYNGETKEQDAYLFNGEYHVSKHHSINEKYIDSVTPLFSQE
jgi:hypothetical protein